MSRSVSVENLSQEITETLENYNKIVISGVKDEAKKSMDQLVKETKATAPVGKRKKHYKNAISSKLTDQGLLSATYTWYVKGSEYRLSHLLENGHATRNGGRTKAFHFIKNASDPIIDNYIKKIEEVIKNG